VWKIIVESSPRIEISLEGYDKAKYKSIGSLGSEIVFSSMDQLTAMNNASPSQPIGMMNARHAQDNQ